MAEKAANECGDFILRDVHHNQAIAVMSESALIKTCVTSEERDVPPSTQKHHDLLVLHPFSADVESNLRCSYPSRRQQNPLTIENILVEKDQA